MRLPGTWAICGALAIVAGNSHAGRLSREMIPESGAVWPGPAEDQPDSRKGHAAMAMPDFTLRQLLEAGVHFGHHTRRWNPRMAPYIFGIRNQVHIMDLQQTVPMLDRALKAVRDITAAGGRVLFVGTKRAAAEYVAESARKCGQYYVNHRWLGGMLTNWKTITGSIKRLRQIEEMLAGDMTGLTKKEVLDITRDQEKLERALGGIKDMGGLPDVLFIIDTNKEKLAVEEATKLGIPVIAVLDSNSDPEGVTFPIPGNDDAIRAITMYCDLIAGAVLDGISAEMVASGRDIGASEDLPMEALPETFEPAENQVPELHVVAPHDDAVPVMTAEEFEAPIAADETIAAPEVAATTAAEPEMKSPEPHADLSSEPHADLSSEPHADLSSEPHADLSSEPHAATAH